MSTIGWLYNEEGVEGRSWNPVTGCSPVSPGCLNCYAAALASREMCDDHKGLTKITKRRNDEGKLVRRPVFNDVVHVHPDRIGQPKRWKKGRRVFVNSMSDLFHRDVPFEFIASVYKTMVECERHTFLVLTKRLRVLEWYEWAEKRIPYFTESGGSWPPKNVHLGVSAENRKTFIERVPVLLRCNAAVRWVSIEPILDDLGDIKPWLPHTFNREPYCLWCEDCVSAGAREHWSRTRENNHGPFLDWVVVGGESGPGSRDCDLGWISKIVSTCRDKAVPVFVKQLGTRPVQNGRRVALPDKKGEHTLAWPDQKLVVQELPKDGPR